MRRILMLVAVLGTMAVAASGPINAQNQASAMTPVGLVSCVRAFYDPQVYNWLSFQNNCSEPLNITYYWRANDHLGSSGVAQPGRSVNTGFSRSDIDSHGGGWELYPCPLHYFPVAPGGRYIENGGSNPQSYYCKHE